MIAKTAKGSIAYLFLLLFPQLFISYDASAQTNAKPRKCIMIFGAHADDVDENAGGTLAKYVAMGYEGIYVCAINNMDATWSAHPGMTRDPISLFPIHPINTA